MSFPTDLLIQWFDREKRDLPWRKERTPYRVWVSEVMLQQTQVKTVLPYYERWMKRFPTLESLSLATELEVTKMWEGLGYYSRARALLKGAKAIMERFGGQFPSNASDLSTIPSLGPYTIGALLNFAFHIRAPLVDGNVMRVMARFYAIDDPIDQSVTQKRIWQIVGGILPQERYDDFSEALMEFGATLCQKRPLCTQCPLQKQCRAFLTHSVDKLPIKSKRLVITAIERTVAIVSHADHEGEEEYLLKSEKAKRLMKGLFEFPYVDRKLSPQEVVEWLEKEHHLPVTYLNALPTVSQSFTRFSATLFVHHLQAKNKNEGVWVKREELDQLPLSSGHRRIVNHLFKYENITQ